MNKEVLDKILTDCEQDIESNNWNAVYKYLNKNKYNLNRGSFDSGEFTDFCLNNGLNPLDTLNNVPRGFMRGSKYPNINIPPTVIKIDSYSFAGSSLEEVEIPESVKEIGDNAFAVCDNLKKVVIKEGCKKIGEGPFILDYNLEEIYIPKSLIHFSASMINGLKNLKTIAYGGSEDDFDAVCDIDDDVLYKKFKSVLKYTN